MSVEVMYLLKELHAQGRTVLLITHDTDIARQAGAGKIFDGRLQEEGSGAMNLLQAARLAFGAIMSNKLRSFLTMLV